MIRLWAILPSFLPYPNFPFLHFQLPVFLSLWFVLFGVPVTLNLFQWYFLRDRQSLLGQEDWWRVLRVCEIGREWGLKAATLRATGAGESQERRFLSVWDCRVVRQSLQSDPKVWENRNEAGWEPEGVSGLRVFLCYFSWYLQSPCIPFARLSKIQWNLGADQEGDRAVCGKCELPAQSDCKEGGCV